MVGEWNWVSMGCRCRARQIHLQPEYIDGKPCFNTQAIQHMFSICSLVQAVTQQVPPVLPVQHLHALHCWSLPLLLLLRVAAGPAP